jgi:hypothetical protein
MARSDGIDLHRGDLTIGVRDFHTARNYLAGREIAAVLGNER